MKVNDSTMTPTNSASDLPSTKLHSTAKRASQSSITQRTSQQISNQRRQSLSALHNRTRAPRLSSPFSVPLLLDTMNEFIRTTRDMEDEIMLPTRLKDMTVDELIFDNSIQPDNWHEIYAFVRDMRNQLQCTCPFAEENNNDDDATDDSNKSHRKYSNDDEGITIAEYSSASSVASSEDFERSSTFSAAPASYESIKDELKFHYYGLFHSLNNLTSMANRVRDKYRDETSF